MTDFLARRVYEGKLDFQDVPESLKHDVRIVLKEKYGIYV